MVVEQLSDAVVGKMDFSPSKKINFFGSDKIKRCWVLPKFEESIEGLTATTAASTSFYGGSCTSCFKSSKRHSCNNLHKLILIGDEFLPPVNGSQGDCCLTIRVDSGSFQQVKAVILFHLKQGLGIKPGSIGFVCLTSHLMRYGHERYWEEMTEFIKWARLLLKVEILPGLLPFPEGLDLANLIPIAQYLSHLQCVNVGCGAIKSDHSYSLWKPFEKCMSDLSTAGKISVPALPIYIKEVDSFLKCNEKFPAGLPGNWSAGTPKDVHLQFIATLLDHLKELDLCSHIFFPSQESIEYGIYEYEHLGRRIFTLGTSILRDVSNTLEPLCTKRGIELLSECKGGNFFDHFKNLDLSFLQAASSRDILCLQFLGNHLIKTKNCYPDQQGDKRTFHPVLPSIPDDEEMALLVVDSGRALHKISRYFPGSIYIFGPVPRHITACCKLEAHAIKGPKDEKINMCAYTSAFSSFIHGSPGIIKDRISYISYHELFGEVKDISPDTLSDGIHLSNGARDHMANFILDLLGDRPIKPPQQKTNLDFMDYLVNAGILLDPVVAAQPSNQLAAQFTGRCRVRSCSESNVAAVFDQHCD